ncbi:MAG: site-specific DNA-methyltransferase [Treponema sp.]|nr:site-specific DNA-methyltransferase [Treponema sp.]
MLGDCVKLLPYIPSGSIDAILTDPPYLYLKGHSFDRPFDETVFFSECNRILKNDGFIALFGRGTSFYRWNTRLAEMGFVFKEEIVWDKRRTTAPCMALSRIHETVSIHAKKIGKIRRTKVPYVEQKQFDLESIVNDVKRIKSAINNEAGLNKIISFLQGGALYEYEAIDKNCVTQQPGIKKPDRAAATVSSMSTGMKEKSIIYCDVNNKRTGTVVRKDFPAKDRGVCTIEMIGGGMREKSIIIEKSDYYNFVHPTEKPVRLAERIIALISDPGDTICDPFMGSGSFGEAAVRTGRKYIGMEIEKNYFQTAKKRLSEELP